MRTEVALKVEVMELLVRTFGEVDAERFITIIKSDDFDYTEWRRNLWKDKSIDEIHRMATEFENEKSNHIICA
jgi:hypothetical protein